MNTEGYIAVSSCHLFPKKTSLKIPKLTEMFLNYKINCKTTIFDDRSISLSCLSVHWVFIFYFFLSQSGYLMLR